MLAIQLAFSASLSFPAGRARPVRAHQKRKLAKALYRASQPLDWLRASRATRLIRATLTVQAASSVPVAGCRYRCCDVLLPREEVKSAGKET